MILNETSNWVELTELLEHFVAFIEYEMFDIGGVEMMLADEAVQTTRCGDNDVGAFGLVLEQFGILGNRRSTVEDGGADVGHVLGEPSVLVFDLIGEFTSVAEDDNGDLAVNRFDLLKSSNNKDGCFSMSRFGLAEYVHPENGLWDTFLLNWRGYEFVATGK